MDTRQVVARLYRLMGEADDGERAALLLAAQVVSLLAEGRCAEAAALVTGRQPMPTALVAYARRLTQAIEGKGYAVYLVNQADGVLALAEDPWTREALANAEGGNPAEALEGLARILGVQP